MDTLSLIQALQMTTGPTQNEIKIAEQYLTKARETQGYIPSLLVIACTDEHPLYLRQIAGISIKTEVQNNWPIRDGINKIPDVDRMALKDNLLEALIKCAQVKRVRVLLENIVFMIAEHDFPATWPNFLPQIINTLKNTNDFNTSYGCLLAFKMLVKNYETELDKRREPLEEIIRSCFGLLEELGQNLLKNYDEKAAIVMNCILKTFYYANYLQLSQYFHDPNVLATWMLIIKVILEKPIAPESEIPTNNVDEMLDREKDIGWNNKKWCGRILQRFFQKYANKQFEETQNKGFSDLFLKTYAVGFLELFIQILSRRKTHFVASKCTYFIVKSLYYANRIDELKQLLLPHLEDLLINILVPMLYITEKDESDWKNDPVEYLRREEDFTDQTNNIKNIALDFIQQICKLKNQQGGTFLINFIQYIGNALSTNTDPITKQPIDLRHKEALLNSVGILRDLIIKNDLIKDNMETMLEKFVIPDFNNQVGFLRARACWLFGEYGTIEFKNKNNVLQAVDGLYKCLTDDQLPVRVKAAISLNCLLDQEEAIQLIKPHLGKILEIYLGLMDKVDNEGIVSALEGIIDSFHDHIAPFAYDLIDRLVTSFFKFNQSQEGHDDINDDDYDDEAELAAAGCLVAIKTIISSNLPQDLYYKIEDLIIPVLNYTLSEEGCDYINDGLAVLNALLYHVKALDEKMWSYFPVLNYIVAGKPKEFIPNVDPETLSPDKKLLYEQTESGWGSEYIEEMMGSLQNYIQKGREALLTYKDPAFGVTYVELLFKSIEKVLQVHGYNSQDIETSIVTTLYICLIENCVGMIDVLIPYIIDKSMDILAQAKTKNLKKVQIETIVMTLWYNTKLSLAHLIQKNYLEAYFKTLIEALPLFKYDFEKRRILFGLASLLKINVQELPPLLATSLTGLMHEIVKMTTDLLELREQDESDDDEDDLDGDMPIDEEKEKKEVAKTLKKLEKFNQKQTGKQETFVDKDTYNPKKEKAIDEDLDDDDDIDFDEEYEWNKKSQLSYASSLDPICEILYLKDCLEVMKNQQPYAYEQLIASLSESELSTLKKNFGLAYEQEIESKKQI